VYLKAPYACNDILITYKKNLKKKKKNGIQACKKETGQLSLHALLLF
jgi:hypothetical protein